MFDRYAASTHFATSNTPTAIENARVQPTIPNQSQLDELVLDTAPVFVDTVLSRFLRRWRYLKLLVQNRRSMQTRFVVAGLARPVCTVVFCGQNA